METQANTVWTKAYTPNGTQVGITFAFDADGNLPLAVDIERKLASAGYLVTMPGVEPGEELATITHVIRATQDNKSDGTVTPIIGLYFEHPKLLFARKAYLDTKEDIATFEKLSGMKLADLPEFPSTSLPKRDERSAQKFIRQVRTPFQVRMTPDTYTDENGEMKTGKKFAGFYEAGSTPPAATTGNGSQGSKPSNVTSLPPQSNASGSSEPPAVDEKAWKKRVMELTAFLYNDSELNYNEFEHTASIQKRMKDTSNMGINPTMSPESAATVVLAYRAAKDLKITTTEFPQVFNGKSLGALLKTYDDVAAGLDDAWIMLVDHAYRRDNKASNQ